MRKLYVLLWSVGSLLSINFSSAQCGDSQLCIGNSGLFSNEDASNIEYDNIGSAFHSTYIKEPNSSWKVWGEMMANNGTNHVLSPISFDENHYPGLTGKIYKMAIGSNSINNVQLIVLTSTGLFTLGKEGAVLDNSITSSNTFQKISVDGKSDGLPIGISPEDVKMLFASTGTLIITTCAGEVYVLSKSLNIRGNGGLGTATQWSKVMIDAYTPLKDIMVTRGNGQVAFALSSDGSLWTWGNNTYLGNGTAKANSIFAVKMTTPPGIFGIKMIQLTSASSNPSYYILGTDGVVYALGHNLSGQLGDNTTTERLSWVTAKTSNDSLIRDAQWISSNEHDIINPGIAIIRLGGGLYTAGNNSAYMIGREKSLGINFLDIPKGVEVSDVITNVEVGGHTCALIKSGSDRYGYVGHRINGSMGDGTADINQTSEFDFILPPIIAVCGTPCVAPTISTNSPICPHEKAVFTIKGTPGDIVDYKLNDGFIQKVTIDKSGTVAIEILDITQVQMITLTHVLGGTGACSNNLSVTETVILKDISVIPVFTQVNPICQGETLNNLPTVSNNGIVGTWSPDIDNIKTTVYTFTATELCGVTANMTIVVNQKVVPIFTPIEPICEGSSLANLPTVSQNGILGSWTPSINSNVTTTYLFTPNEGVCATQTQMTIVVNPKVNPTFDQPTPLCEGDSSLVLPVVSLNGIEGIWYPTINSNETTTYTFTPNSGFCAQPTQLTITVEQKKTPVFNEFNPFCYGESEVELPLISNNGISGHWSPALNTNQTTTYTFTPIVGECAKSISKEIQVHDDFDFEFKHYCQAGNYTLEVFPKAYSFDLYSASVTWQHNNVTVGNDAVFDVTSYVNSISNSLPPYTFDVTVGDANGCSKSNSITISTVLCEIQKGISPNGDKLNDSLDLTGLNVEVLSIFNRYGVKVYSKSNYVNEWNGQDNNGNMLPDGVYYYVIDLPSSVTKTGWIYVIREKS